MQNKSTDDCRVKIVVSSQISLNSLNFILQVYLERLLTYAEIEIVPANWKRIVLGAILLASKVWDDQAVWNIDYCQILKDITVEDMYILPKDMTPLITCNKSGILNFHVANNFRYWCSLNLVFVFF